MSGINRNKEVRYLALKKRIASKLNKPYTTRQHKDTNLRVTVGYGGGVRQEQGWLVRLHRAGLDGFSRGRGGRRAVQGADAAPRPSGRKCWLGS